MSHQPLIEIQNLHKSYALRTPLTSQNQSDTLEVLKGINLTVSSGEIMGIVGINGSGKSTLLKILSEVTKPTEGDIFIRGKVASILDIGAGFHPDLSGRENVFLNGQLLGFKKEDIEKVFDEIVTFSEISEFIDQPVKTYSNGMYLRLAFSIIIHLKCDIFLLDEVLAVGDQYFMRKCLDALKKKKEEGVTILIISHDIELLTAICDRIVQIEDGIIKELESFADLLPRFDRDDEVKLQHINHRIIDNLLIMTVQLSDIKNYNLVDIGLNFDGLSSVHSRFALSSVHNINNVKFYPDSQLKCSFQLTLPILNIKSDKYILTLSVIKNREVLTKRIQNCYQLDFNHSDQETFFYKYYPNPLRLFADWKN